MLQVSFFIDVLDELNKVQKDVVNRSFYLIYALSNPVFDLEVDVFVPVVGIVKVLVVFLFNKAQIQQKHIL